MSLSSEQWKQLDEKFDNEEIIDYQSKTKEIESSLKDFNLIDTQIKQKNITPNSDNQQQSMDQISLSLHPSPASEVISTLVHSIKNEVLTNSSLTENNIESNPAYDKSYRYGCPIVNCDQRFKSINATLIHLTNTHNGKGIVKCDKCNFKTFTEQKLEEHLKENHIKREKSGTHDNPLLVGGKPSNRKQAIKDAKKAMAKKKGTTNTRNDIFGNNGFDVKDMKKLEQSLTSGNVDIREKLGISKCPICHSPLGGKTALSHLATHKQFSSQLNAMLPDILAMLPQETDKIETNEALQNQC